MRRLIAVLSLMGLTNLVFVQAGSACPLVAMEHATGDSVSGHEGHGEAMSHDVPPMPDETTPHGSSCPAMNACVATLDLAAERLATVAVRQPSVAGGSDDRPASLTPSPEIPPPRA